MDSLITVIFFIIVAVLSAVLKKKQPNADDEESWSGPSSPGSPSPSGEQRPSRRESWEEELRRLLEGQTGRPSPPPPPPPAPVMAPPPPLPSPAASSRREQSPSRGQATSPPSRPAWMRQLEVRQEEAAQQARKLQDKRAAASNRLQESMKRLRHASQLDDRAALTIRRAADRIHYHAKTELAKEPPGAIKDALSWMKSPGSLRSAMVASIILGPPKASEFDASQNR